MAYNFVRPVTCNHALIPSDQTNFPLTLVATHNDLRTVGNGGHIQNASGHDLQPFSDLTSGSAIKGYQLEYFDAVAGTVVMHVKLPNLSSSVDTVFYLRYGDASISTRQGSQFLTWDANHKAIYHLGDIGGGFAADATSNGNDGGLLNGPTAGTGQIDGAVSLSHASIQYVLLPSGLQYPAMTFSAWIKATSFPGAYNSVISSVEPSFGSYHAIHVRSDGKLALFAGAAGGGVSYDGTGSHTLVTGTWYRVAFVYSAAVGLIGYVNGSVDGTAAANGALTTVAADTRIGQDSSNAGREWNGLIDEARISDVARSADAQAIDYNHQSDPGSFFTLGAEISEAIIAPQGLVISQAIRRASYY